MPLSPAVSSKNITALSIGVSSTLRPTTAHPGDTVTLSCDVTMDGSPFIDVLVEFYYWDPETGNAVKFDERYTDVNGHAESSITAKYDWGCKWVDFAVYLPDYDKWGTTHRLRVEYRTRLTLAVPDRVIVGKEFTVRGKLEYEEFQNKWYPLSGRVVNIYIYPVGGVERKVGSATTGADGTYTFSHVVDESGTYIVKVVFPGTGATAILSLISMKALDVAKTFVKASAVLGGVSGAVGVSKYIYNKTRNPALSFAAGMAGFIGGSVAGALASSIILALARAKAVRR